MNEVCVSGKWSITLKFDFVTNNDFGFLDHEKYGMSINMIGDGNIYYHGLYEICDDTKHNCIIQACNLLDRLLCTSLRVVPTSSYMMKEIYNLIDHLKKSLAECDSDDSETSAVSRMLDDGLHTGTMIMAYFDREEPIVLRHIYTEQNQ